MENGFHTQVRPRSGGKTMLVCETAYAQALDLSFSFPARRAIGEVVMQATVASAEKSDTLGVVYYENAIVRASVKSSDDMVCVFDLELKINPSDFDDDPTTPGGAVMATILRLTNAVSNLHQVKTCSYQYAASRRRRLNIQSILEEGVFLQGIAAEAIRTCHIRESLALDRRSGRLTEAVRLLGARVVASCKPLVRGDRRAVESPLFATGHRGTRLVQLGFVSAAGARMLASCRLAIGNGRRLVKPVLGDRVTRLVRHVFEYVVARLRTRRSVQPHCAKAVRESDGTLAFA